MKKLLCILSFILVTTGLFAQKKDCKQFKTGTYKMTFNGQTVIIKRTPTTQLEYLNGTKLLDTFIINWIDDCTYILKPTTETLSNNPKIPKNIVLTVKITNVSKQSYSSSTSSNMNNKAVVGEVIKLSDSYK